MDFGILITSALGSILALSWNRAISDSFSDGKNTENTCNLRLSISHAIIITLLILVVFKVINSYDTLSTNEGINPFHTESKNITRNI
jgi:hypothetical protein